MDRWHLENSFQITFNVKRGLQLPVKIGHNSIYKESHLEVILVPPDKISILDKDAKTISSSVGPFLEGEDLRIFCDVHGGKPPPTLSWSRDGRFVSNVSYSKAKGYIRGELVLKKLRRSDVHSEIICSANNNNSTQPLSASVRIDMNREYCLNVVDRPHIRRTQSQWCVKRSAMYTR
ncbi:hypothetical protein QAD02_001721 [Eretmocerus hayati]|uniref:Uncharacterized protein n=1 Tax=Eretmocerus hayati TaxID=131215 RepID=A0ACC2NH98_9HYME|nr:hypothetical protein QAD02_001721 [Eretmocerus hayati]